MKKKTIGVLLTFSMFFSIVISACALSNPDSETLENFNSETPVSTDTVPELSTVSPESNNSTIYYAITHKDRGAEIRTSDLEEQNSYESYSIDMFTENDNSHFQNKNAIALFSSADTLNRDSSITFNPKDYNINSKIDEDIDLPIFTSEQMYQTYSEAIETGNIVVPRQLSANIFINENEEAAPRGIIGQRKFTYCTAYVSTVDEYTSGRTRKRHIVGFSLEQNDPNYTAKYISTSKYDNKPDILGIAWTIGGATTSSASTTSAETIYSYIEKDLFFQNYINKSNMTAHNSYCTGNGVGFEVPDTMLSDNSTYRTCYPALYNLSCATGWYNVGGYDGATGYLKGSLYHTFQNKQLYITPSISLGGISFAITGGSQSDLEVGWAEGTLSPY